MVEPMDGNSFARPRLSVVLPARDEEENVVSVVETILARVARVVAEVEILVVDDGSRDRTAERVRALAEERPVVRLLAHASPRGYGAALRTGFAAARFDWLFYTDADGQFPLEELPLAIESLTSCDAVVGFRRHRADPLHRRLLGRAWTGLVHRATGARARDVNCAFKLFPRSVVADGSLASNGAAISTELLLAIARRRLRVLELGVDHRPRVAGSQTGARASVALEAVAELAAIARRSASIRAERASVRRFDLERIS